jgi:hypothetical protein
VQHYPLLIPILDLLRWMILATPHALAGIS